jgi:hypothetical protein
MHRAIYSEGLSNSEEVTKSVQVEKNKLTLFLRAPAKGKICNLRDTYTKPVAKFPPLQGLASNFSRESLCNSFGLYSFQELS